MASIIFLSSRNGSAAVEQIAMSDANITREQHSVEGSAPTLVSPTAAMQKTGFSDRGF
jgi:hypothetical protein